MNSDLVSVLSTVQDPRSDKNKRYLLEEILLLCVCAAISRWLYVLQQPVSTIV